MRVLERYARWVVRRRRAVLAGSLVGLLAAAVAFVALGSRVTLEGFVLRGSESYDAKTQLDRAFGVGLPNVVLVVTARSGTVDGADVQHAGARLTAELAKEPGIANVVSYFGPRPQVALLSKDRKRALILARIRGDDKAIDDRTRELRPKYSRDGDAVQVGMTGYGLFLVEASDILAHDLSKAELVTAPITLAALLVIFGSVVAASIPLAVCVFVVLGTGGFLFALTFVTDISALSLFFVTVLGLGLAIDYSLFIVSRFREELQRRQDQQEAAVQTIITAGHTVIFSAVAIGLALAGLLVIPLNFMRSLGLAGLGTALVAGSAALLILPALLAVLGERLNKGRVWGGRMQPGDGTGFWHRAAQRAMLRPRTVLVAALIVLLGLGSFARFLDPGLTDERLLGTNAESRRMGDVLRTEFNGLAGTPVPVLATGVNGFSPAGRSQIDGFARQIVHAPQVVRVDTATGTYTRAGRSPLPPPVARGFISGDQAYFSVTSDADPLSERGRAQVKALRALPNEFQRVAVTGDAAVASDVTDAITSNLPYGLLFVAIASFLALMLQSRSIGAPVLSMCLSVVSLSVMYAFLVYVFQEGHGAGLLDFVPLGTIYINIVILLFCFAYGLSLDYQVFLYSRIREHFDQTGDHEAAIAHGLGRSGRIMSAAAVLIAVVFVGSGVLSTSFFGKSFGITLGAIVLLDAFVIRGTLVPAAMKLVGPRMWWAPGWLAGRAAPSHTAGTDAADAPGSPVPDAP